MPVDIDRDHLIARLLEFATDPLVNAFGDITPETLSRLAAGESATAAAIQKIQLRAEELAHDAFVTSEDDCIEASFHLLEFSPHSAVGRLSDVIKTEAQLWAFGDYLLTRYQTVRENPELVFSNLNGRGPLKKLLEVILALLNGATRPSNEPNKIPEGIAAFRQKNDSNLYKTVIVHGTGAASNTWWREHPRQWNFWAYIRQYCPGLFGTGKEFTWSGGITDADREQGARDFINWWNTVGAPKSLQVIAHSHGCNVVYLACVMEPRLHIINMVSLGGPAKTWYPPPIATQSGITRIHNIYSRHDIVQVMGSIGGQRGEGRTLGDSVSITNYHVPWEDPNVRVTHVGHSNLHEPVVWHNNRLVMRTLF